MLSTRINPSTSAKEFKVLLDSSLYTDPSTHVTITGLDTWTAFPAATTGYIYLKSTVEDYALSGDPTMLADGPGGDFAPSDAPWNAGATLEDDGETPPAQKYFRILIGTYDTTGAPKVVNIVKNNLIMKHGIINGYAAYYPDAKP